MRYGFVLWLLVAAMCLGGAVRSAVSDEPRSGELTDAERAAEALELTRQVARWLQLSGGPDRTTRLTLRESPLQQFSNPIVGEFYANLFIWTSRGRPEAAVSVLKWYAPNERLGLEVQSLAEGPLTAECRQATFWHPEQAGVTLQLIPGSPQVARTAPARLREMRLLARQFRARTRAVNRAQDDIDEELRLLSMPVYRYESADPRIRDGAIFSFVRGTDPELLLLVEARQADGGFVWKYAFARMNSFEFTAFHRDRQVWQAPQLAPPWPNVHDPTKPYMLIVEFDKRFLPQER